MQRLGNRYFMRDACSTRVGRAVQGKFFEKRVESPIFALFAKTNHRSRMLNRSGTVVRIMVVFRRGKNRP